MAEWLMQRCDNCGRASAMLVPVPRHGWSSAWVCGDCSVGCTIEVGGKVDLWEREGMGMPETKGEG